MRSSPSIVPTDRLDRDVYLVLEDFGARAGCTSRETDETETDLETVIRLILADDYAYPVRIEAFNATEGWSRDATSDVADAVAQRAIDTEIEVSAALQAFITKNSTRAFDIQLSLPLAGREPEEVPLTEQRFSLPKAYGAALFAFNRARGLYP
jgi:hypothetical protein